MKVKFLILFFLLLCLNLSATNYYYIAFYPKIEPIKKLCLSLKNTINNDKLKFIVLTDKNIFKNTKEILDAVQSNLIQLAILPAWTINNNLRNVLGDINFKDYNTVSFNLIPYREKLENYGLFLLEVFFGGEYSIFSKFRIDKKENYKKIVLGSFIKIKNDKKFYKILLIDDTTNLKSLVKSDIINCALLTSIQYYNFDLINSDFSYKNNLNKLYSYFIIVANNVFWNNLNFNNKSFIWSFITNYQKNFTNDFFKFKVYVENLISQKLLILNLGDIVH